MIDPYLRHQSLAFNVRAIRVDGGYGEMPSARKWRRIQASIERKRQKRERKAAKRGAR